MKERNHGIDLLRIISMLMVLTLHLMSKSFILQTNASNPTYYFGWLLEVFSYCAVNCYALISGYVGYGRKVKYSNLLYLCFQVSLYSVLFTVIQFAFLSRPFSTYDLLFSFLPFDNWFFIAYFAMFLFTPFFNQFLDKADKKTLKIFLLTCTILFCFIPIILRTDLFGLSWGYHFIWLSFLYIFGSYIKKYNPFKNLKKRFLAFGYFSGSILLFLLKILEIFLEKQSFAGAGIIASFCPVFINYNSPIVLFNAICLLLLFAKMEIRGKVSQKLISVPSSVSLGVFLLHIKAPIRDPLMNWFSFALTSPLYVAIPLTFGFIIAEYIFCGLLDYLRKLLFDVCKIRKLCIILEKALKSVTYKFFKLFKIDLCDKIGNQPSTPISSQQTVDLEESISQSPPTNDVETH